MNVRHHVLQSGKPAWPLFEVAVVLPVFALRCSERQSEGGMHGSGTAKDGSAFDDASAGRSDGSSGRGGTTSSGGSTGSGGSSSMI